MVPDGLLTVLRQREGNPRGNPGDAVAAGDQLGIQRIEAGGVIDALRRRGAAPGRVDLEKMLRMLFQQQLQARRQLRLVVGEVVAAEPIQGRIAGVRIGMVHARPVLGRRLGQAARPRRNAAGSVAGALTTQRG
ncbi:hypothetical protein D3C80_1677130 [compost metagenome]